MTAKVLLRNYKVKTKPLQSGLTLSIIEANEHEGKTVHLAVDFMNYELELQKNLVYDAVYLALEEAGQITDIQTVSLKFIDTTACGLSTLDRASNMIEAIQAYYDNYPMSPLKELLVISSKQFEFSELKQAMILNFGNLNCSNDCSVYCLVGSSSSIQNAQTRVLSLASVWPTDTS